MMLYSLCRSLFTLLVAYPVTLLWLGLAVRHKERLPERGPAIVIANHNSHLDFLVLLSLFPLKLTPSLRTAAAADYFFTSPFKRRIARWVLGLVPVSRGKTPRYEETSATTDKPSKRHRMLDSMQGLAQVLSENNILLLFPEGTRGETPEEMTTCKAGVWHLLKDHPEIPVYPVYLHGLGRSMPKGTLVPVPFFIDICIGDPLYFTENKQEFMQTVHTAFTGLRNQTIASLTQKKQNIPAGAPSQQGGKL